MNQCHEFSDQYKFPLTAIKKTPLLWYSCPCDQVWIPKNSDKVIYCRQTSSGVQCVQQVKAGLYFKHPLCFKAVSCSCLFTVKMWHSVKYLQNGRCKNQQTLKVPCSHFNQINVFLHLHSFHFYSAYISMLVCLSKMGWSRVRAWPLHLDSSLSGTI